MNLLISLIAFMLVYASGEEKSNDSVNSNFFQGALQDIQQSFLHIKSAGKSVAKMIEGYYGSANRLISVKDKIFAARDVLVKAVNKDGYQNAWKLL